MSEAEIKAGDVVALKSGGPPMTVAKLIRSGPDAPKALCVWFQGEEMPHEKEFALATLTVLEDVDMDEDDTEDEEE